MIKFKGYQYYNEKKAIFDEKFMKEWESVAGRTYVGGCSAIFQKYKPNTIEEFIEAYTNDYDRNYNFEKHIGSKNLGRSEEQLMDVAKLLYNKVSRRDKTITLDLCFDAIVNYVLIATYLGHIAERTVAEKLISYGKYDIEETYDDIDAVYGVDIIVKDKTSKKVISYIQVKPLSSFYHEKYRTRRWVKDYYEKQNKLNKKLLSEGKRDEIKEIKYIIYDYQHLVKTNEVRFLCKGDRLRFSISELCDSNGTILLTKNDLVFKEI